MDDERIDEKPFLDMLERHAREADWSEIFVAIISASQQGHWLPLVALARFVKRDDAWTKEQIAEMWNNFIIDANQSTQSGRSVAKSRGWQILGLTVLGVKLARRLGYVAEPWYQRFVSSD